MTEYKFKVIETRSYSVWYTVEADSEEEAQQKTLIGDTIEEESERLLGVTDRTIDDD